jgi:hypothetical protein
MLLPRVSLQLPKQESEWREQYLSLDWFWESSSTFGDGGGLRLEKDITYELLSYAIERSNNIVSLFKELKNIRIDA